MIAFSKGGVGMRVLLTLLHSERPKLYVILAFLLAIGLKEFFSPLSVLESSNLDSIFFLKRPVSNKNASIFVSTWRCTK